MLGWLVGAAATVIAVAAVLAFLVAAFAAFGWVIGAVLRFFAGLGDVEGR